MKNRPVRPLVLTLFVLSSMKSIAQQSIVMQADSLRHGKYLLLFASNDAKFDSVTRRNMIDAFFTVYPQEVERFNKNSLTRVVFFIDTAYKAVAETGNGTARFNPAWMRSHPQDIDVVTHEVMHIVQDYKDYNPGWLTEGIADYVRYVYGVNNKGGDWTLPNYRPGQSYKNAYRVTARFLVWVEKKKYSKIVDDMDKAMRDGTYTTELWVKLTGKTVDGLWSEYAKDPSLELTYK